LDGFLTCEFDDGLGEGGRGLLGHVVPDAVEDPVFVRSREPVGVGLTVGIGSVAIVIVGVSMVGRSASLCSKPRYRSSPSARPNRQR
jgi:hypothetical protein